MLCAVLHQLKISWIMTVFVRQHLSPSTTDGLCASVQNLLKCRPDALLLGRPLTHPLYNHLILCLSEWTFLPSRGTQHLPTIATLLVAAARFFGHSHPVGRRFASILNVSMLLYKQLQQFRLQQYS